MFSISALVATHPLLQDYFLQPFYGLETSTTPLHWYLARLPSHYNIAMRINFPIRTNITISPAHSSILDFAIAQKMCKASSENFTWGIKTIQFNKWKKISESSFQAPLSQSCASKVFGTDGWAQTLANSSHALEDNTKRIGYIDAYLFQICVI